MTGKFKYEGLVNKFKKEISSGVLKPAERMPSEPDISKSTGLSRNTIRQAMKELEIGGYLYRIQGKGTFVASRENKSRKIALVLYDSSYSVHPFTGNMIEGIGEVVMKNGYSLEIIAAGVLGDFENEALKGSRYAGFILGSYRFSREIIAKMIEKNIPFVFAKNYLPGLKINAVLIDYKDGGKMVMEHLLALKHTKIALLNAGDIPISKDFTSGVLEAAGNAGIKFTTENVFDIGFDITRVDSLIDKLAKFTAVITFDDDVAIEVIRTLKQKGKDVPDDIAVTGCNDMPSALLFSPAVTTIRVPIYELGKVAGEQLLNIINGNCMDGNITLSPELIARGSTGINNNVLTTHSMNV